MVSPITHHRVHIHIHTTTTLFTVATIVVTASTSTSISVCIPPPVVSGGYYPEYGYSNSEAYQPY
jgi:hypothetical protein